MASWILPKNERWGNFQYIKLPQRSFFGRIQDNIFFFRDYLTFSSNKEKCYCYMMYIECLVTKISENILFNAL